jgi:hypothetical protein
VSRKIVAQTPRVGSRDVAAQHMLDDVAASGQAVAEDVILRWSCRPSRGLGAAQQHRCDRHPDRQLLESYADSRRDLADPPARSSSLTGASPRGHRKELRSRERQSWSKTAQAGRCGVA